MRARAVAVAAAVTSAVVALALAACGTALRTGTAPHGRADHEARLTVSDLRHGSLPAWLPQGSASDAVLTGTAARPALTEQGDAVDLHLTDGRTVTGTVSGPVVPGEGLPVEQPDTTATFTVRFTAASAPIALSAAQFRASDHLGHVYPMTEVPGAPAIPSTVAPGQTVQFQLRAVMITGEGVMQWAPDEATPLAEWDFVVEND